MLDLRSLGDGDLTVGAGDLEAAAARAELHDALVAHDVAVVAG